MKVLAAFRLKVRKIVRTVLLKILHPSVRTDGAHLVRPGTEIIVRGGGRMSLGKNVSTYRGVALSALGGDLRIGSGVALNRGDVIVCRSAVTIGDGCAFGPHVAVYDHDHRFSDEGFSMDAFRTGPVVIEERCWIGANVTILRGTHIGAGCVIGAGTVVKGEIPAHSLVRSGRELVIEPIGGRT